MSEGSKDIYRLLQKFADLQGFTLCSGRAVHVEPREYLEDSVALAMFPHNADMSAKGLQSPRSTCTHPHMHSAIV